MFPTQHPHPTPHCSKQPKQFIHVPHPKHPPNPPLPNHKLKAHIIERVDPKDMGKPRFLWRVEVLDRRSGTHLGHVFNGG